jgi:hypothetical protein
VIDTTTQNSDVQLVAILHCASLLEGAGGDASLPTWDALPELGHYDLHSLHELLACGKVADLDSAGSALGANLAPTRLFGVGYQSVCFRVDHVFGYQEMSATTENDADVVVWVSPDPSDLAAEMSAAGVSDDPERQLQFALGKVDSQTRREFEAFAGALSTPFAIDETYLEPDPPDGDTQH